MRAIAAILLLAGVAQAAPTRAEVEKLLSGYEPRVDADSFRRLGAGVDHVLVQIAVDGATSRLRRQRAMAALAWVPSVEGRDLLRAVAREKAPAVADADLIDLYTATRALGAFGPEVAPDLLPLLAHPSSDVRAAAATSLAQVRATNMVGSLRLRLTVERDEAVLRALAAAIRSLSN